MGYYALGTCSLYCPLKWRRRRRQLTWKDCQRVAWLVCSRSSRSYWPVAERLKPLHVDRQPGSKAEQFVPSLNILKTALALATLISDFGINISCKRWLDEAINHLQPPKSGFLLLTWTMWVNDRSSWSVQQLASRTHVLYLSWRVLIIIRSCAVRVSRGSMP